MESKPKPNVKPSENEIEQICDLIAGQWCFRSTILKKTGFSEEKVLEILKIIHKRETLEEGEIVRCKNKTSLRAYRTEKAIFG